MRYFLNDLLIDTEAHAVFRGDAEIKLTDLSFNALVKLIEAAPHPVSVAEFSSAVWHTEHVSDETIAQRITLLRKALEDDPKNPTYIRTMRGLGYAIVGSVVYSKEKISPKSILNRNRRNSIVVAGLVSFVFASALFWNSRNNGFLSKPETQVADANPKSPTATLVDRAREQLNLHQAQETSRAIVMLREALAQHPGNFDARLTLSFALSTKATKFGGDSSVKKEAEAIARTLINEQPKSSNAWSALGYSLGSQGRMSESLPAYQHAYQLNPKNAPAISSAAYVHLMRGELHQALSLEFQARQAGGTSRYAEIQIAQSLELIDHPAVSVWHAKALSLNPGQVVIISEIARSHLRHGDPQAALDMLGKVKGDDQSAPQILQLKGRAAIMVGRMEEARHALEAAGWRGHYDLAALEAISGDTSRAEQFLLPSKLAEFEFDPDPEVHIQLAEISAVLDRDDLALRLLAKAINLGWRDAPWMKHSPFFGRIMSSSEGRQLESQIERELDAQRRLIEGADELMLAIGS